MKAFIMHFGKYRGKPLETVRGKDPSYYRWAIENVAGFSKVADQAAEQAARKAALPDHPPRQSATSLPWQWPGRDEPTEAEPRFIRPIGAEGSQWIAFYPKPVHH